MAVALALLGCARERGGQTGDEDAPIDGEDFWEALARAQGFGNYPAASSIDDLAARSDAVVVARPARVERGRSFTATDANGNTRVQLSTIVMHLSVLDALKGEPGESLYLEFYAGDAEAQLPAELPSGRVLVFATPAPLGPIAIGGGVQDEGRGLPQGATLRRITTPQGFALEAEGGVVQLFERTDTLLAAADFDELVERVRDALHPAVVDGDAGRDAAPIDSSALDDASATDDAGGALLSFTDPLIFSLPISSIRYGVSAYDPTTDLCVSAIWQISTQTETRFCEGSTEAPEIIIQPGVEAGCWDYASNATLLEQRGCVDFGELTSDTDDAVDVELDVRSALFTGTVRFQL